MRCGIEPAHFVRHQLDDVFGDVFLSDKAGIPLPARGGRIEGEKALRGERLEELRGEEGVSLRLVMHESCERRDGPPRRAQRIGKHGSKVVFREIADSNSFRRHAGLADVVDGADEGMRRADFVFTISADEHEMAALGIGHEHVQKVERGGVAHCMSSTKMTTGCAAVQSARTNLRKR